MDAFDISLQIDQVKDSLKEIKDDATAAALATQSRIDALSDMLKDHIQGMEQKIAVILERTKPRSMCVFCTYEDNKDSHPTGRSVTVSSYEDMNRYDKRFQYLIEKFSTVFKYCDREETSLFHQVVYCSHQTLVPKLRTNTQQFFAENANIISD
ncbi:unnamed protein product [Cylicocyclus nassatus]|uniref:Uncharacterized protein n=1 Tax=Cylicocyclus nassatus TaxID=53992 RepID=A0AA36GNJ2_CYLNA|nr:unnamed protein product [Cylicocyclus nassatus]